MTPSVADVLDVEALPAEMRAKIELVLGGKARAAVEGELGVAQERVATLSGELFALCSVAGDALDAMRQFLDCDDEDVAFRRKRLDIEMKNLAREIARHG